MFSKDLVMIIILHYADYHKVTFNLNGFMMFRVTIICDHDKTNKGRAIQIVYKMSIVFYFPNFGEFGELLKKVSFNVYV